MNEYSYSGSSEIIIPLDKRRLLFLLLASLALVGVDVWLLSPVEIDNPVLGNPVVRIVIGLMTLVFFGFLSFALFRKFVDRRPGLIINEQGVTDNSSSVSGGLIRWTDIDDVRKLEIKNSSFIMLVLKDPETFIDTNSSGMKRQVLNMTYKQYGSPVAISTKSLKIDENELYNLITDKWRAYR